MNAIQTHGASFRDPAGFVFRDSGLIKRVVTSWGLPDYELLMSSGLYEQLSKEKKLISHKEEASPSSSQKILLPQQIPFISYPYEWSVSQFKDAAILTLEIEVEALKRGLSLKDATPFNVQFLDGKPVFIDTLSFEKFDEAPWVGYKQFCELFLAPLALMAYVKPDFNRYLANDLSGFSLEMTSKLLPRRTWLQFGLLSHIHLHAASQAKYDNVAKVDPKEGKKISSLKVSKNTRLALIDNLLSTVKGLKFGKSRTSFGDYYDACAHYSKEADAFKQERLSQWAEKLRPSSVLDLGGNNGKFSRLFTKRGIRAICADADPNSVEENYLLSKSQGDTLMQPVLMNLSTPAGGAGWMNQERDAFAERAKPGLVLALALIHHLRISANVPIARLAEFFAGWHAPVIIEFVPKSDVKVKELLTVRKDTFPDYTESDFQKEFARYFDISEKIAIPGTERTLYLFSPKP